MTSLHLAHVPLGDLDKLKNIGAVDDAALGQKFNQPREHVQRYLRKKFVAILASAHSVQFLGCGTRPDLDSGGHGESKGAPAGDRGAAVGCPPPIPLKLPPLAPVACSSRACPPLLASTWPRRFMLSAARPFFSFSNGQGKSATAEAHRGPLTMLRLRLTFFALALTRRAADVWGMLKCDTVRFHRQTC
jgi:hypothetical protein